MNLPNKLTLFRVFLAPVMVFFWLMPDIPHNALWALAAFAVASITDTLDGNIARKYGLITDFGKLMDPLADKIMVSGALLCFLKTGHIPCVALILVIFREFIVTSFRLIAAEKGVVIPADVWGKIKTVFQIVCIILTMLAVELAAAGRMPAAFPWQSILTGMMWVMAGITVLSGAHYIIVNRRLISDM